MDSVLSAVHSITATWSVDGFNKFALALVALVTLIVAPWMQWRIAKKQAELQASIASRQLEQSLAIARRHAADNVSSKRQSWIDELRKDIALFLVALGRQADLQRSSLSAIPLGTDEHKAALSEAALETLEVGTRIQLRLNFEEADHQKLIDLMFELRAAIEPASEEESAEERNASIRAYDQAKLELIHHVQRVLKREWERIKSGDV